MRLNLKTLTACFLMLALIFGCDIKGTGTVFSNKVSKIDESVEESKSENNSPDLKNEDESIEEETIKAKEKRAQERFNYIVGVISDQIDVDFPEIKVARERLDAFTKKLSGFDEDEDSNIGVFEYVREVHREVDKEADLVCDPKKYSNSIVGSSCEITKGLKHLDPKSASREDDRVEALIQEALELTSTVEDYLVNDQISIEARYFLLIFHIKQVVLPMRGFLNLVWSDSSRSSRSVDLSEELMVQFPAGLIQKESIEEGAVNILGVKILEGSQWGFDDIKKITFDFKLALNIDAMAFSSAINEENYMSASRSLGLEAIISRMRTYQFIVGVETPVDVPLVCQYENGGNLSSEIYFPKVGDEETRTAEIDKTLIANGLIVGTDDYRNYYIDSPVNPDPSLGGFNGLLLFEKRKAALAFFRSFDRYDEPGIDDFTYFNEVKQLMKGLSWSLFSENNKLHDKVKKIFEKVITIDEESGFPQLITEKIDRQNFVGRVTDTRWSDVVNSAVKEQLQNTKVLIEMPQLVSNDAWRRWGLRRLLDAFVEINDGAKSTDKAIRGKNINIRNAIYAYACPAGPHKPKYCLDYSRRSKRASNSAVVDHLIKVLSSMIDVGEAEYLPKLPIDEKKLKILYPKLRRIWKSIGKMGFIQEALITEWDLITAQISDGNPWASIRVAYLMGLDDYRWGVRKPDQIELYKEVGEKFGLDNQFVPMYGNKLLSKRNERSFFWNLIMRQEDKANNFLFNRSAVDYEKETYYDIVLKLNNKTILNQDSLGQAIDDIDLDKDAVNQVYEDLNSLFDSPEIQKGDLLFRMFQARNDLETQIELSEEFFDKYGVGGEVDAKDVFLTMDTLLKRPIYHQIVKASARLRIGDLSDTMEHLCNTKLDDVESFKEQFYMTTMMHKKVNELAEIKEVPIKVTKHLDKWSQADWDNMKWGVGSGLFFGGGMMLSLLSGGSLPVLIVTVAMFTGAVSTQWEATEVLWVQKNESFLRSDRIRIMAELGLTDNESAEKIKRGWGEIAFDLAFAVPMVGALMRTGKVLGKVSFGLLKNVFKTGVRKTGLKNIVRSSILNTDLISSRFLLGYSELKEGMRFFESAAKVDVRFGREMVKLFDSNPSKMHKFLEKFRGNTVGDKWFAFSKTRKYFAENDELVQKLINELQSVHNKKDFQKFVSKHADELSELLYKSPLDYKEIPYFITVQGLPWGRTRKALVATRVVAKRLAVARENLIYESLKQKARESLGVTANKVRYKNYELFESFVRSLEKHTVTENVGSVTARNVRLDFRKLQQEIVENIFEYAKVSGKTNLVDGMDKKKLGKILFSKNLDDKAKAAVIWNQLPIEKIYKMDGVSDVAFKALKEISGNAVEGQFKHYRVREFQDALNALRILYISKKPESLIQFL